MLLRGAGRRRRGRRWRPGWRPARTRRAARPVPQRGVLPRLGQRADDEGLAGAGRADQRLDPRTGGEHAAHRGGLVGAELDTGLGQLRRRTAATLGAASAAAPRAQPAAASARSVCTWSGVTYSVAPGRLRTRTRRWRAAARPAAPSSPGRSPRRAAVASSSAALGQRVQQPRDLGRRRGRRGGRAARR